MTRKGALGILYAASLRVAAITAMLMIVMRPAPALADAADQLIKQLESDSSKIRLAAAVNLAKLGNAKAILPLAKSLGNDDDKDVRAAAAVGLGRLVDANTNKSIRGLAIKALQKASNYDEAEFVKQQAGKSLVALGVGKAGGGSDTGPSVGKGGAIYVNIGPMSSKTGNATNDPTFRALMVKVATSTLGRSAPKMATTWAGGKAPTRAQLTQKGFQGFYVDGTLNTLSVKTTGSSALVECKISMLLASFPDKSVFGFLNGGAKVQGSSSPRDIVLAGEDCISAVIEDLIAKKIVPTINSKAGAP